MATIGEIQNALGKAAIDGWLFYDFRLSDPIAYRILGLTTEGVTTRRWFYFVPASGAPIKIVSAVEVHRLDALEGAALVYRSAVELRAALAQLLTLGKRIAINYSPNGAIPYVSRVDAGTVELIRSFGVELVSAANLIQLFEATLTASQLASHHHAALILKQVVDETFQEVSRRIARDEAPTEHELQSFVMARFSAHSLFTAEPPIVAVNAHSADPHLAPSLKNTTRIQRGDFLLLDLWARERGEDSIYADFTWVAYAGEEVPAEHARVFRIVAAARDAALELIQNRVANRQAISGREADRAAREVIEAAGFGAQFLHRTGHSIGREVHSTGANLDSLETEDDRELIENTCFSIEPGIYLEGKFGVRSEIDVTISGGSAKVSADARQTAIFPLLRKS